MTTPLKPPDSHYLEAAQGWLGLGNHQEAEAELDQITPQNRSHPDVLQVRWRVYAKAEKWSSCLEIAKILTRITPERRFGWLHYAQSLHKLNHTAEAKAVLLDAMGRFEPNSTIPYYLACYSCRLGDWEEARSWLMKAFAQMSSPDEAKRLKSKALEETDLESLRAEIDRFPG